MARELKLELKRQDFLESSYLSSYNCAITRALARAGYPRLVDIGTRIGIKEEPGTLPVFQGNYNRLANIVTEYYGDKDKAIDFEFTLQFTEDIDLQIYV